MVRFVLSSRKICCWDGGFCPYGSCSWLDGMGNVVLCDRHRNPSGYFMRKLPVPILVSIFDKHVLRRS